MTGRSRAWMGRSLEKEGDADEMEKSWQVQHLIPRDI